jgi:hypothetical protein
MKQTHKYTLFFVLCVCFVSNAFAQEITPIISSSIDSTSVEKEHKVTFSVDLVNRYIWRGQSWGGNYVVVQPTIEYAPTAKLTFGLWATTNFKNDYFYEDQVTAYKGYQEIDFYVSYAITKYISVALWDYYWPSVSKVEEVDNYFFNYGKNSVQTVVAELVFDYTDTNFPAQATISTFIAGNDYRYNKEGTNPKQNYTTYVELGYVFNTFKEIELNPVIGAVLNNQAEYYTAGDYDKVSILNIGLKATKTFKLKNSFELPISLNFVHNGATKNTEVFGKNFLLFGISICRN